MPIRLPCSRVTLKPSGLLHGYWGTAGLPRPLFDLYVAGPGNRWIVEKAQIDSGADYTLLTSGVASQLGLSLPYPRKTQISGAAGMQIVTASFPPDGLVSLFVTDYREYAYLARPLVGFHPPSRSTVAQRSVLGLTGFLQHFRFTLDLPASPPCFELEAQAGFPGSVGPLPRDRALADFLASLRGSA